MLSTKSFLSRQVNLFKVESASTWPRLVYCAADDFADVSELVVKGKNSPSHLICARLG